MLRRSFLGLLVSAPFAPWVSAKVITPVVTAAADVQADRTVLELGCSAGAVLEQIRRTPDAMDDLSLRSRAGIIRSALRQGREILAIMSPGAPEATEAANG